VNRPIPLSLRPDFSALLPAQPAVFRGPSLAWWFTSAYLVLVTVRSLIHVFAPDGGAQSIATIDTSVAGGHNIIAIFGQWGAIQLLLAALLWLLIIRYPGFVPLVLLVLLAEPVLRSAVGHLKPLVTMGTAPGAALNWVAVPVLMAALWLALCPAAPGRAGGSSG
jgi:hypothetical protein